MNLVDIKQWFHLGDHTRSLQKKGMIDVLLGADNHKLMTTTKEVPGEVNKGNARLCPLGWMAIGQVNEE